MPLNLELKIRLDNPENVLRIVKKINADFKGELKQIDVYYKIKTGLLKLRLENGSQTLIKYLRNEKPGDRWSDFHLISLEKNDARKFLAGILDEETVVEKRRLLYLYDNTRIHIDMVKELGSFLEFETLVDSGKEDAKKRFDALLELLSIKKADEIRKSYRDMMLEKDTV